MGIYLKQQQLCVDLKNFPHQNNLWILFSENFLKSPCTMGDQCRSCEPNWSFLRVEGELSNTLRQQAYFGLIHSRWKYMSPFLHMTSWSFLLMPYLNALLEPRALLLPCSHSICVRQEIRIPPATGGNHTDNPGRAPKALGSSWCSTATAC